MLTSLEKAVLDMLLDVQGEPFATLRQQMEHVTVIDREFTGVGFFTTFSIRDGAPVACNLPDSTFGDVGAEIPGLMHGAGFVLFIRDGGVSMLEGYTYDQPWPATTDGFKLHRHGSA
jgi:hypothetical protein